MGSAGRLGARRTAWRSGLIAAAALLLSPSLVDAYLIHTAPPEDVLPHASHVVRVALPATEEGFRVEVVYRGDGVGEVLAPHRLPSPVSWVVQTGTVEEPFFRGSKQESAKATSLVLALYAMDGRFHVVGRHPRHGIPPHSSAWVVSERNRVYGFQQVMNPGQPVPCPAKHAEMRDFEPWLRGLLDAHPFEGPRHTQLPATERAPFLGLVEPTVDWYEQSLADRETSSARRVELARQLVDYAREAPESLLPHVLRMLVLLSGTNHAAYEHEGDVAERTLALVREHGVDVFAETILEALDRQPYMAGSRAVLLWVLKKTDAALYHRGVEILRALCRRQRHNEALDARRALRFNGETLAVREIDALWAEQEAEEAERRAAPEAPQAADEDEAPTPAASTPPLRPRPRIEVGDVPEPAPGPARKPEEDGGIPWLLLGLALAALVLLSWLVRRTSLGGA